MPVTPSTQRASGERSISMMSDRSCELGADVDAEAEAEAEAESVALCEQVNRRFGGAGRLGSSRL